MTFRTMIISTALLSSLGCSIYRSVSVCAIWSGDKFLIVQNARGPFKDYWGIPGGKANMFEQPYETALREVYEETHIILTDNHIAYRTNYLVAHGSMQGTFKISVFETYLESTPDVVLDPTEHLDYRWIRLDEMDKYKFIPESDRVLKKIYSYIEGKKK